MVILDTGMTSTAIRNIQDVLRADDPDSEIVERIREGETRLYEQLIRRHNQRLFRVARAFLRDADDVQDVMQEAWLRAYAGLSRFQGRALFSTWLTRILINCAREHVRRRSRRPEVALDTIDESGAAMIDHRASDSNGERRVEQEQVGLLIEKAIDTLPVAYRAVFVMREVEKAPVAETAACLGLSPVNVKVRLHRAKRLLRGSIVQDMPDISLYSFLGERCDALTRRVMEAITTGGGLGELPSSLSYPEIIDQLGSDMGASREREEAEHR